MATVQVKRVPDELRDELRRRASAEGTTMSDLVIRMLRTQLSLPSVRDWLADVEATRGDRLVEIDVEALMDEVRDNGPDR
ncbi:MAG: hypothetical protein M3419_03370 [Actinomycetota bacterium]|nr:hypothetical protein [Actinomycetota bacterium]